MHVSGYLNDGDSGTMVEWFREFRNERVAAWLYYCVNERLNR